MSILLDSKKYINPIKVAQRAEYDKYIVTILDRETNDVFGSVADTIGFELEEKLTKMLLKFLNQSNIKKEKFNYIEHGSCCILYKLEDKHIENQYHDQVVIPLTNFRAKTEDMKSNNGFGSWIQNELPENIDVVFNKMDGSKAYFEAEKNYKNNEQELKKQFDKDFIEKSGVSEKMFTFLTKSIQFNDRKQYMNLVTSKVNEYLEVAD